MADQTPARGIETRKGRGQWTHWAGTPNDLADLALLAQELIEDAEHSSRLNAKVNAPAFEAEFEVADDMRD